MLPPEWIYFRAMSRRRARAFERRARETLPCPIISVGNLTTGGTGKTPTTQWLVRQLESTGRTVGIAGRGYGGTKSREGALVSDGKDIFLSAREAGDEAVLHARNLPGCIVAIGADRHRAATLCVEAGAQIVVLDDGFQFWSLPRDFELVLLDAKRPFGNGRLLPMGRLREERAALERADAIVFTRADRPRMDELARNREMVARFSDAPQFEAFHAPRDLRDEKTGEALPLSFLKGKDVSAFAGLADNTQFYRLVRELTGVPVNTPLRERGDHHRWKRRDFWQWTNGTLGGNPLVTTEKDAVKVVPDWFREPLLSLRIEIRFRAEEDALVKLISDKIRFP